MEEQAKVNEELYKKVTDYLKGYAEDKQLHVVLKYNTGSDLLYGGTTLDITKDVIGGLNERYKQELASTTSKADSIKTKRSNRNSPPTEATDVAKTFVAFLHCLVLVLISNREKKCVGFLGCKTRRAGSGLAHAGYRFLHWYLYCHLSGNR
ncbi:MAG: outer membrane chaperone Skp [Bacteroidetes bacterium OLB12]|nr:MAG: outer membrane chaperone Skp [Bacteroidetes bacterium OLB12]